MLKSTEISKKFKSLEKMQNFQFFEKKIKKIFFCKNVFFLEKKLLKSQDFGHFFVASDVIKKLYSRAEFRTKLKKYFKSHDIETMIQNFEQKYRFFHNFQSKFQNTIKFL